MNNICKWLRQVDPVFLAKSFFVLALALALGISALEARQAFDKSGHVGTVWTHVNDWKDIPFAQDSMDVDYALQRSHGDPVQDFALMARVLGRHGVDGIYLQGAKDPVSLNNYLTGFAKAGNGRKVALFVAHGKFRREAGRINAIDDTAERAEAIADLWADYLNQRRAQFLEHPNYHRVDGHPVIALYGFGGLKMTPELWAKVVPKIEERAYRCIWLYHDTFWREGTLEAWMPHVDGVTQYASGHHSRYIGRIAEPMKEQWPEKIFEANAGPKHQSVLQGQTGHDRGMFTAVWRERLNLALGLAPDSLHLTNWNDIEENSHIFPSYLQRDTYLRIFDAMTRAWRGEPPYRTERPEVVVSSKLDTLVGEELAFEVLLFGLREDGPREVTLELRLTDAAGDTLHAFEPRTITADTLRAVRYEVQSANFPETLAVFPEVTYQWGESTRGPFRVRGTRLWYGQKPTDMVWMTPLDQWAGELAVDWRLQRAGQSEAEAASPGEVAAVEPGSGEPFRVYREISEAEKGRDTEAWLLENGEPKTRLRPRQNYFRTDGASAAYRHSDRAPFGWLELAIESFRIQEVPFGDDVWKTRQPESVWTSRPIFWARGGEWRETVETPVPVAVMDSEAERKAVTTGSNYQRNIPIEKVIDVAVPRYRIPFWHYRIEADDGGLFYDASGYKRHGWLGTNHRNRHAVDGPFGFRFSHLFGKAKFPVEASGALNPQAPAYAETDDGVGYLNFDGEDDYVFLPPRSRMPFAATYEVIVRGQATGEPQTLIGTPPIPFFAPIGTNKLFTLRVDGEGRPELMIYPENRRASRIRAEDALSPERWTHVAAVYDAREWRLYVDGEPVGEPVACPPRNEFQAFSHLLLGIDVASEHRANALHKEAGRVRPFAGDLAEARITGRPLGPGEFLQNEK